MGDSSSAPLESVDRALRLLLMARDHPSVSVKEAADHLGVAPSTAHRLLAALSHRGFVVQDHTRRYRAGPAMQEGSPTTVPAKSLIRAARPSLEELQAATRETAHLMVLHGTNIRFLDGVESDQVLRISVHRGDEMPAFVSSGGKAMLARLSNADIEDIFSEGLSDWPTRRLTTLRMLKREMTKVRRQGHALSIEETERGVVGLGVSITSQHDAPVAALTLAIPSVRFDRTRRAEHVARLEQAATQVQQRLIRL